MPASRIYIVHQINDDIGPVAIRATSRLDAVRRYLHRMGYRELERQYYLESYGDGDLDWLHRDRSKAYHDMAFRVRRAPNA